MFSFVYEQSRPPPPPHETRTQSAQRAVPRGLVSLCLLAVTACADPAASESFGSSSQAVSPDSGEVDSAGMTEVGVALDEVHGGVRYRAVRNSGDDAGAVSLKVVMISPWGDRLEQPLSTSSLAKGAIVEGAIDLEELPLQLTNASAPVYIEARAARSGRPDLVVASSPLFVHYGVAARRLRTTPTPRRRTTAVEAGATRVPFMAESGRLWAGNPSRTSPSARPRKSVPWSVHPSSKRRRAWTPPRRRRPAPRLRRHPPASRWWLDECARP